MFSAVALSASHWPRVKYREAAFHRDNFGPSNRHSVTNHNRFDRCRELRHHRTFFTTWLDERRDKRKNKDQLLLEHSKTLTREVFLKWFSNLPSIDEKKYKSYVIESGCVVYDSEGKAHAVDYDDPYLPYFDQAKSHLVTGYPEIWSMWNQIKRDGSSHLVGIKDFVNELQDQLRSKIMNDEQLGTWTENDLSHIDFRNLTWYVFEVISRGGYDERLTVVTHDFILTSDPRQIVKFSEIVEKTANDPHMRESMKKLLDGWNSRLVLEFKQRLNDRADEVNQTHTSLLGECYRCKQIKLLS